MILRPDWHIPPRDWSGAGKDRSVLTLERGRYIPANLVQSYRGFHTGGQQ